MITSPLERPSSQPASPAAPAVKEHRAGAHQELGTGCGTGLLPQPARGEGEGCGPLINYQLELAVGERLDAVDVGDIEILLA